MKKMLVFCLIIALVICTTGQAIASSEVAIEKSKLKNVKYKIEKTKEGLVETGTYTLDNIDYKYRKVDKPDGTIVIDIFDKKGKSVEKFNINKNTGEVYQDGKLIYQKSHKCAVSDRQMDDGKVQLMGSVQEWDENGDTHYDSWANVTRSALASAIISSIVGGIAWGVAISLAVAWIDYAFSIRDMYYNKHIIREFYPDDDPTQVYRDTISIQYFYDPDHSMPEPEMFETYIENPIIDSIGS